MRIVTRLVAALALLVPVAVAPQASAAVWDDDAGLVFFGRGYSEPTQYADAFNALEGRTLTTIAGTSGHFCAIDESGQAFCWGEAGTGRLGTGARPFPPDGPSAVSTSNALAGKTLVDIDGGGDHTCAVDDAGQAYCWGRNREGQLGHPNGPRTEYSPVKAFQRPLPDGVGFVDVTTGDLHSCALSNAGDAYCWGRNYAGQLGTGDRQDADRPTRVKPGDIGGRRLIAIDAGASDTCAVDTKGRAYCWGENVDGQLGNGGQRNVRVPTKVAGTGPNGLPIAAVSAGGTHTCASTRDGRPFCWGSNTFNQVSPSDRGAFDKPHKIATGRVSEISAGTWYTCAVETTDIYCWGRNSSGQIGDGTKDRATVPTKVESPGGGLNGTEPAHVQATYSTTCAMDAAGVAFCWGTQGSWMTGRTWRPALTPKPVAAEPTGLDGATLTDLTDSGFSWCAMRSPTQPTCWSEGPFTGPTYNRLRGTFRDVPTDGAIGGAPLHSLDSGTETACALDDTGKAYCWGSGALGVAGVYSSRDPVAVDTSGALADKTLVDIATDEDHTCAVDDAGKAYCWGEDNFGEVGNGDGRSTQVPEKVVGKGVLKGEVLVAIETSMYNTCALSDDGDVFCWGGWLGDGSGTTSQTPVRTDLSKVSPGETVTSLHGAHDTPCFITDAGHAYCWGSSYTGQTGTGKVTGSVIRPNPVVRDGVLSGVELTDLVMPNNRAMCGLSAEGRIYCWGDDQYGVLGNGDFDGKSSVPVAVIDDGVLAGAVVTDLGASEDAVWAVVEQAGP